MWCNWYIKQFRTCVSEYSAAYSLSKCVWYRYPKSEDLIAYNKSEQEIASLLGIKQVIYNDLDDIIKACSSLQNNKIEFETCCFDGIYFDVKYN